MTLTSAKMREATIPKPKIAFRRVIAADEKENYLTNTDLFNTSARKSCTTYMTLKDELPNFCTVQPDAGVCLSLGTKYYYDINNRECKDFLYGGCGGNRNKFDTKQSCLGECGGS
ncbi:unnamed protein product [Parnassius apollo]|uniref:(apollo) hypothetical protein n=1 Tax=Parnassius apollo TaxID=110799 RepID=A0A8S3XLI5_PARAO|nr:unnamed protein product [Parnassius apollo]